MVIYNEQLPQEIPGNSFVRFIPGEELSYI